MQHNQFVNNSEYVGIGLHVIEGVIEILTAVELAQRLKVKSSWVIDASQPARNSDSLPVIKVGRHNRYGWNSKSLSAWLARRFEII